MKVDVRNLDFYQDDEQGPVSFEKQKKKQVPNEFKKINNKKMNKPKRINHY